jgi:hypothetical protein
MALKVYLTVGTGMLNFVKDAGEIAAIPSQSIIYDIHGVDCRFYRNDLTPKPQFLYAEAIATVQNAAGAAYGATETLLRAALDPIVGVQKTV